MNHADLSPNPDSWLSSDVVALTATFFLFSAIRYKIFAEDITMINIENTSIVIHAVLYSGGGDNVPKSHVTRIPPEFAVMNAKAVAVARRV